MRNTPALLAGNSVSERGLGACGGQPEGALVGNEPTQHPRSNPLGLLWLVCEPHSSVAALGLTLALQRMRVRVHTGLSRPKIAPSSIMLCVEDLRRLYPDSSMLVFGVHAHLSLAKAALREGARGFVHAGMSPQQIVRAVEVAAEGELAFPRALLEYLMLNEVNEARAHLDDLTARQAETLEIVREGLSNTEIGERLSLSESTIEQHLRAVYKVLGVRNRTEATKLFRAPRSREAASAPP